MPATTEIDFEPENAAGGPLRVALARR